VSTDLTGPPGSGSSLGGPGAALHQFRRILENNNRVIETITNMERALGGEYVFDRAFLNSSVSELLALVREVIYSLNTLADQRYLGLYDRFSAIANHLNDLVSGGPGPYDHHLTLPYQLLHRDLDYLVGAKNATLGEIANQLKLPTPDGFALTATAYGLFLDEDGLGHDLQELLAAPGDSTSRAAAIATRLTDARLPASLVDAVDTELDALRRRLPKLSRLAVRSSAVGEDSCQSCAGQFISLLNVKPTVVQVLNAYRQVVASRFAPAVLDYLSPDVSVRDFPMAVCVQTMVDAKTAGVIYTRDPLQPNTDRLLVTAVAGSGAKLVSGRVAADRYVLERRHPFSLRNSAILIGNAKETLADGHRPLDLLDSGLRRGSALLSPAQLRTLAEIALLLEKTFDCAQDIEWATAAGGRPVLLQSRPLRLPVQPPPPPETVAAELKQATVLMSDCGSVVQLGIAAGTVIHVTPESEPADFPVGAIAVCHHASPRLSPIVRKAAAIITDIGGPTVHLATIAREYRTPALFGTERAFAILPEGLEITVDVESKRVYAGRIEGLISIEAGQEDLHMQSSEVRTLRRLLRWVAPLSLVDPASPEFSPSHCRTLHDLIRFCHEKAMENLVRLQTDTHKDSAIAGRRLKVPMPISLKIIDLDNGLAPELPADGTVELSQVRCRPLQALLRGLLDDQAWDREPVPFGIKDLMSSLSRPLSQLVNPPVYEGDNLAIVAVDYCNLSLRLGYHFNVIDCFMSEEAEDNYIYFRFVGGFAERQKRQRRLEMIGMVLANLHFKVEQKGDLLIGKAKILTLEEMADRLRQLGQLAAFSRQLDMRMADDAAVERFFSHFLQHIGKQIGAGGSEHT
jgi:pyruvate,water dikinase